MLRFVQKGFALDIDTVNLAFLAAGILLHRTPMAYARAVAGAARGASGIMIQFPFYAGIQALMDHAYLKMNKHYQDGHAEKGSEYLEVGV